MAYNYNIPGDHSGQSVRVKDLWKGFREDTTAHGIPHVTNASGKCKTGFWLVVSIIACGILSFHLYTVCNSYFAYKTTVKVSILQDIETTFPTVTVCNVNPIKKSALHLDTVLEELLSDDAGETANETNQKRKKRNADLTCTVDVIYNRTGLCYGVLIDTETLNQHEARLECININAGLYTPASADIENFVTSTNIFDGFSFNTYWIYMLNNRWNNRVPVGYTNFYQDMGEPAAAAVISEDHRWTDYGYLDAHAATVCQKMVACPYPVYTAPDATKICWFWPYGNLESRFDYALDACERWTYAAHLIELDTVEKQQFLINQWGGFNDVTGTSYWLGLQMNQRSEWAWSGQGVADTWSNWDTANGEPSSLQGTVADIINNHLWRTADRNDNEVTALLICEVHGLEYNGFFSENSQATTRASASASTATSYATTPNDITTMNDITTQSYSTIQYDVTTSSNIITQNDPTIVYGTTTQHDITTQNGYSTRNDIVTRRETSTLPMDTTTISESTFPDTFGTAFDESESHTTAHTTILEHSTRDVSDEGTTQQTVTDPGVTSSIHGRPPLRESFILEETVIENLASINDQTRRAMGYDSYELIVDCQYEGWTCHTSMFHQVYDPIFGNCYMFNSGWNNSVPLQSSHRTGRRFGLSMVLNVGVDEYLRNIGSASGIRIIVHDQSKMPHPDEDGYFAKPGELSSIGIKKVIVSRKSHPYGNCTHKKKHIDKDIFSEKYKHVHYSRQNCLRTCYQREIIRRCGCADAYYPMEGRALGNTNHIRECRTQNIVEDDCRYMTNLEYANGQLGCSGECQDPCYEEYFISTISTAAWPSLPHVEYIIEKYGDIIPQIVYANDTTIYQNLLSVEVFYDDFHYEMIEEVELYKTGQFASDIGGILGLWIGCSVISIFEFFELTMDLIVLGCNNCISRCRSRAKRDPFNSSSSLTNRKNSWYSKNQAEIKKSKQADRSNIEQRREKRKRRIAAWLQV